MIHGKPLAIRVTRLGPDDPMTKRIDDYLRCCLSRVKSPSMVKFVEDLAKQWDEHRFISSRQHAALKQLHAEL